MRPTGGQKPKLGPRQVKLARELYDEVDEIGKRKHTVQQIANEFGVTRPRERPQRSCPTLRDWINERLEWPKIGSLAALLLNRRGGRLSTRSVDDLVVRLGHEAGIAGSHEQPPVTPNALRHTFGTRLLHQGIDVVVVADLMGHKRLDTARRYIPPNEADREHAISALLAQ